MDTLKAGVIGVGNLGQHHARIYAEMEGCELIGIADINQQRARQIAQQHKTKPFYSYEDLLGKVDAVSIAVPTIYHHAVARSFLERGVHVLVEKPITATVEEAEDLEHIARDKGVILQVGHIENFNVAVLKLKEVVDRPMFIEVHRMGSFSPRVKDIGVVLDLMIHDIEIILRIVNSPIRTIEAVGVPVLTNKEDIANARIMFENGCTANITVSRVSPKEMRKLRLFQKDTYISLDYRHQSMDVYRKVAEEHPAPGMPPAKIVHKKVKFKKQEPLKLELEHFISCVRSGGCPIVDGTQARSALQVTLQVSNMIAERIKSLNEVH